MHPINTGSIEATRSCQASITCHVIIKADLRVATGNKNHLVIENSTLLGNSVNWAYNHLYALQRKDSEPHSTYPYNSRDPNAPVVDFAKFFDGESLDQEDIVM